MRAEQQLAVAAGLAAAVAAAAGMAVAAVVDRRAAAANSRSSAWADRRREPRKTVAAARSPWADKLAVQDIADFSSPDGGSCRR